MPLGTVISIKKTADRELRLEIVCGAAEAADKKKGAFRMEATRNAGLWRVWVDTVNRIVSFHEAEGFRPIEFRSREMFLSCVDEYTGKHYRYQ